MILNHVCNSGLGHGDTYDDKSLNVYEYFNTSCYSGYGDDENVSRHCYTLSLFTLKFRYL